MSRSCTCSGGSGSGSSSRSSIGSRSRRRSSSRRLGCGCAGGRGRICTSHALEVTVLEVAEEAVADAVFVAGVVAAALAEIDE